MQMQTLYKEQSTIPMFFVFVATHTGLFSKFTGPLIPTEENVPQKECGQLQPDLFLL